MSGVSQREYVVEFFYNDGGVEKGAYLSFIDAIEEILELNQYVNIEAANIIVDDIITSRVLLSQHQSINLDKVQSLSFSSYKNEVFCNNEEIIDLMYKAFYENQPVEIMGFKYDIISVIHNYIIRPFADIHEWETFNVVFLVNEH